MNIGIFGTGMVGETIATKLVELGHAVKMGSRTATNEKGAKWVEKAGKGASQGTFADAARFGEILFNCTSGAVSLDALQSAGADALRGKILIDVANPLGAPGKDGLPMLENPGDDSLGERLQRAFPETHVVKTLNTINCKLMVNAASLPGEHTLFMCGNDAGAKAKVRALVTEWFGWKDVLDLGDITTARGTEGLLPLWLRLMRSLGTLQFNVKVVR